MIAASKKTESESRWHSLVHLGLFALVVSGTSWNYDPWLFVRLRLISDDAFAFGGGRPQLLMDDSAELLSYQPKRIAEFLSFPSVKIRTAASLSLAERQESKDPEKWTGVAPKLIRAFACETAPVARDCFRAALQNLPCISPEDAAAVVAYVDDMPCEDESTRALHTALLYKAVAAAPHLRPDVVQWSIELLESPDADERRDGFDRMAALAPQAPEIVNAFRAALNAGDPDQAAKPVARRVLRANRHLVDAFLKGSPAERSLIHELAREESRVVHHPSAAVDRILSGEQMQIVKASTNARR
jgi:hypothetical protein